MPRPRRLSLILTVVFLLPVTVIAALSGPIEMDALTERAALLSAMVNMPEGTLSLLEHRFAGQLDPEYNPTGNESDVAPYLSPWNDPDEPKSSPKAPETTSPSAIQPTGKKAVVTDPSPAKDTIHTVPVDFRGRIVQENMSASGTNLIPYGEGLLRNYTEVPDEEIKGIMEQGMNIHLEDTDQPQVLIFHTHATESYEPYDTDTYDLRNTWRTTNNNDNMVAVGDVLEKTLRDAGIGVIHDKTQHDYPSYNGSYERSAETIKGYLKKYPTIKIALDIHRDGIQREDDLIVKPVVEVDGKKASQLMIITGSDDGTMNVPKWRENLRFAASVQDAIEQDFPGLTRPIFFCYRKYNMDLTTGSLLFEVGSNANTLEESKYTAGLIGQSIAKLLNANREVTAEKPNPTPVQ